MTAPTLRALTCNDRCDRCGAVATAALQLKSGSELMFCGHHFNDHNAELIKIGALLVGTVDTDE